LDYPWLKMHKKRDIDPEPEQVHMVDPGFSIANDLRNNFIIGPRPNQMNLPFILWLSDF